MACARRPNRRAKPPRQGQPVLMSRPENGLPEDIREHMRLMADILALAFQTNKTSVATLLLCRDISGMFYPFLPVTEAHHLLSHKDQTREFTLVNRYYTGQLAYLAGRLQSMKEGEGTVLDNTCLLFMSNMWSGSRHDSSRVPVLTLGNFGGDARVGPCARLLQAAGREAAAVQHVPVAHGSHGRRASCVRRRDRAAGRTVMAACTCVRGNMSDPGARGDLAATATRQRARPWPRRRHAPAPRRGPRLA